MRTNLKITDRNERHCVARAINTWRNKTHLHVGDRDNIVFISWLNGFPFVAMADRKAGRVIQVTLGSKIIEL